MVLTTFWRSKMDRIIGGQGTGKTRELIKIAYEKNATVVCETPDRMVEKMHAYGYVGIGCISYEEYINNKKNEPAGMQYVVDDIEAFLYYIAKGTIAFSVSDS